MSVLSLGLRLRVPEDFVGGEVQRLEDPKSPVLG